MQRYKMIVINNQLKIPRRKLIHIVYKLTCLFVAILSISFLLASGYIPDFVLLETIHDLC